MNVLNCPVCNGDNVHLGSVTVTQGDSRTHVANGRVVTSDREANARGSSVSIDCLCESDHRFALDLHFHKGVTFVGYRFGENPRTFTELWRD